MIGDWVKIKGHLDYDKVQEISRDENMQWYISFACSATLFRAYEFEPVLLTPEILEKNGWKDRENLMELRVNEDTYFLWSKGYGVFTGAFINQIGCYICDFKYVHTLQHLLRHYGLSYGLNELNELANNFQI